MGFLLKIEFFDICFIEPPVEQTTSAQDFAPIPQQTTTIGVQQTTTVGAQQTTTGGVQPTTTSEQPTTTESEETTIVLTTMEMTTKIFKKCRTLISCQNN